MKNISKQDTLGLLSLFVWGYEPPDIYGQVITELNKRGIDLDIVRKEVDNIIKKHSKD